MPISKERSLSLVRGDVVWARDADGEFHKCRWVERFGLREAVIVAPDKVMMVVERENLFEEVKGDE
jgi:hypothetical protein